MSARETFTDRWMTAMSHAHRLLLKASRGQLGATLGPMKVVELHTIGRRSGKMRSAMLSAPIVEDGRYILIASKGGDDRDPFWFSNLVANPDVELTVGGVTLLMRARVADAEEKAALWPRVTAAYGGYSRYQEKTARDIPVVICEPR
ncbi:deazaflavin-dependent oxidoreductase (nitroreductase family) [Glaciihabitans tibetensis]|uniref:Deazaflavin-dependent oxidoreductase (Nitroreductase family) n=1 Tax=Glaciihabitans tibetensis TaxID=1266600 RepID=A0A2T0VGR3_9MICO|nr:nitroreductase/quinone reductase family protein [Glaciihabitans tibetensis]PRY69402.1 deazaflavin-dependent oxidoreductase (nitroreductase family) [Glaciihabitans tibetensis]